VNLKIASNLFSLFLAAAIGICIALNIPLHLRSHSAWLLFSIWIGIVILWLIILWLVRIIIRQIKPLSLIGKYGTMLYRVKKGEIEFVDYIDKSEMLEKISVGQLNCEYIDLRRLEEIKTKKIFLVEELLVGLEFKVEKLSFIFHDSFKGGKEQKESALKFFQCYGNRQRAVSLLKDAADRALQDTFDLAIKTEGGRRFIIEADNYDLQKFFEEKLKAVLKKEKHLYELCDDNFDFSFVWTNH